MTERPPIRTIPRESVRAQVLEQLRERIIDGIWNPGEKLPSENDLAQSFGVSRITVREALQKLSAMGLLETRHGEGTFVKRLSADAYLNPLLPMIALDRPDLRDVLEYRRMMEVGTVELAAARATEQDIAELEAIYDRMLQETDRTDSFADDDLEFHLALARASGNAVVYKVNEIIRSILTTSMRNIVHELGTGDGVRYHGAILAAVKARDAAEAKRLMAEHVERTIERINSEEKHHQEVS